MWEARMFERTLWRRPRDARSKSSFEARLLSNWRLPENWRLMLVMMIKRLAELLTRTRRGGVRQWLLRTHRTGLRVTIGLAAQFVRKVQRTADLEAPRQVRAEKNRENDIVLLLVAVLVVRQQRVDPGQGHGERNSQNHGVTEQWPEER